MIMHLEAALFLACNFQATLDSDEEGVEADDSQEEMDLTEDVEVIDETEETDN